MYALAALRGINGADLDANPPYVVRWMLSGSDDTEGEEGVPVETPDDLAAVALARGQTQVA